MAEVVNLRKNKEPTVPTTFKMEKEINPFLRLDSSEIISATQQYAPDSPKTHFNICQSLREMKNNF